MPWSIPDKGTAENDIQSILFSEYLNILADGIAGDNGVYDYGGKCAVTAQGSPDMTVAIADGLVMTSESDQFVTAGNGTVTAADGTNPRLDLAVITSAGGIAIRAGTPDSSPKPPTRTAGDVGLAVIFVPAAATSITTARIKDLRVFVPRLYIQLALDYYINATAKGSL